MSAAAIEALFDAMKSLDQAALLACFSEDVVVVEPPSLPYGGTTTSREAFFQHVFGYASQRASFRVETSEVFGDGDRLAGHFTATFTAIGSGETVSMNQTEVYEVTDGVISRLEVFQQDTQALIDFFDRNGPVS